MIVYGTGFKAAEFLRPCGDRPGGPHLREAWRDGAQAYLGITVAGFPNFFMLYGPNTNLGGNSIIYMLEGQIGYVLGALRALNPSTWPGSTFVPRCRRHSTPGSVGQPDVGVGDRLPQLVHHLRAQHQQLA